MSGYHSCTQCFIVQTNYSLNEIKLFEHLKHFEEIVPFRNSNSACCEFTLSYGNILLKIITKEKEETLINQLLHQTCPTK